MYSYGPPHMAEQKQDDQLEHTYSSYVRIWDVALKTCRGRWTIGKSGERGSGISVLAARHDDDDDSSERMDCRDENSKEFVKKMLKCLRAIGANMGIKVLFLHSHLDRFQDNCGNVSDEQRERFDQDIKTIKECYQRRWDKRMMADCCWSIKKDLNNIKHDRQSKRRKFLP